MYSLAIGTGLFDSFGMSSRATSSEFSETKINYN